MHACRPLPRTGWYKIRGRSTPSPCSSTLCFLTALLYLLPSLSKSHPYSPRYVDVEEEETTMIAMTINDLRAAREGARPLRLRCQLRLLIHHVA